MLKKRNFARVHFKLIDNSRHKIDGKVPEFIDIVVPGVHKHACCLFVNHVAKRAFFKIQVLVENAGGGRHRDFLCDLLPKFGKVLHIVEKIVACGALCAGSDDIASFFTFRAHCGDERFEPLALSFILNALGNTDVLFFRKVYKLMTGKRYCCREPRPLSAYRIFGDLNDD